MVKYKIYPTLINYFQRYYLEKHSETGEPITEQQMLDRINRVKTPLTDAMLKGIKFEEKVLARATGKEFSHESWEIPLIDEVIEYLPEMCITQRYVDFVYKDVMIYGFVDFKGSGMVVDLKTTSYYNFPEHEENTQTLYLYALKHLGYKTMRYIVVNLEDRVVGLEEYNLENYDFSRLFEWVELFKQFLEAKKHLITDKRIFA